MLDLTGKSKIHHEYVHDAETGNTTITFRDDDGGNPGTVLGDVVIETVRYRKFLEMLSSVAKEQFDDLTPNLISPRTVFSKKTTKAVSVY